MLARIGSRWLVVLLVGMAWLGSYGGCDTGAMYGNLGTVMGGATGFYDGAYVVGNDVYYPVDSGYDPYVAYYYDGYAY